MAGTGTVSFVGAYLEVTTEEVKTVFFGMYIEENWDGSPIIVSTDGEQSPIFGVFR